MSITKQLLHNKLERWKHAANQLISGTEEDVQSIELAPDTIEKCRLLAEERNTTVNEVVNSILEQHWQNKGMELTIPISREQLERNPLFLLDSLTSRNFRPLEETSHE
jgi:hypothetical protein